MNGKLVVSCLMVLLTFLCINTHAQVTVGTDEDPLPGALLQLKDTKNVTDGSVNSTKGLGSPRVYLIEQDKLKPMYTYDTPANTPSATNLSEHIGLFVYNTNICLLNRGRDAGPYVWDGLIWEPLFSLGKKSSSVNLNTDQDGNTFKSRIFKTDKAGGIDAGEWMVENLRAKTYAQTGRTGDDASIVDQMPTAAGMVEVYNSPIWCYPGPDGSNATDPTYLQKQPDLGLLYNWAAATNSKGKGAADGSSNNSIANGQGHPGYKGDAAKTQGICPNGWHLPNDNEWNLLEQAITADPSPFSRYTGLEPEWYSWDPAWNTTIGLRPPGKVNNTTTMVGSIGHGNAMKNICNANDYTGLLATTFGESLASDKGGFAVLMSGYAFSTAVHDYGFIAHMHTSTSSAAGALISRIFFTTNAGVDRTNDIKTYGLSVRCKKDDTTSGTPIQLTVTCPTTSIYDIFVSETISSYTVSYTSTTVGAIIPAYSVTDNGITVSHDAVTLSASGTINVTVTGTAAAVNNSVFNVAFGSEICPLTINARPLVILDCPASPVLTVSTNATINTTISIPYTNGHVGSKILASTAQHNGITITVLETALAQTGNVTVTVTGMASTSGTITIPFSVVQIGANGLTSYNKGPAFEIGCSLDFYVEDTTPVLVVTCPTTSIYNILVGETINSYTVSYTSTTVGTKIPSYSLTENGITISHPEITLSASGTIPVTVTGTAGNAGTSVFNVAFGSEICSLTINVTSLPTFILDCNVIPAVNNIKPALPIANGTTVTIPYTSNYDAGTVTQGQNVIDGSTSVNGITATIATTTIIEDGTGNIVIQLAGTPLDLINSVTIPIKIFDYSCNITVNMIDLTDADLPNSYFVKPGSIFTFPVAKPYVVWSNEPNLQTADAWNMQPIVANEKTEVLWSQSSTSSASPVVTLNGHGKYATITIDASGVNDEVNAFVAYFDGTTVVNNLSQTVPAIRWSYHIWVTNYDPDNGGMTYPYDDLNPLKQIMDRNLGALGGIYQNINSKDAQGLLYQWGRKDPFPYVLQNNKIPGQLCSTCTFIPDITNFGTMTSMNLSNGTNTPYLNLAASLKVRRTHAQSGALLFPLYYYGSSQPYDWMLDIASGNTNANATTVFNSWSKPNGTSVVGGEVAGKGYYDPCPTGWRVPDDVSVFSKITVANGTQLNPGAAITSSIGNFPMPGSTSASNAGFTGEGAGGWGLYWTAKTGIIGGFVPTANIGGEALNIQLGGSPTTTIKTNTTKFKSSLGSVRCIKNL